MNEIIYENTHSIPKELCRDIIKFYESNTQNTTDGSTFSGINKNIRNTKNLEVLFDPKNPFSIKLDQFLKQELNRNLMKYKNKLQSKKIEFDEFNFIPFSIVKYEKNEGHYKRHIDYCVDWQNKKHRVISYVWYLNDVEEGGETFFDDNFKIKPQMGKLLLFPSAWHFPHSGAMPISNSKYIIVGWIYSDAVSV